jgi:hypothetical protein
MNVEKMQALSNSLFCSSVPERHQRYALSGFNHFAQLLVLLGLAWASRVSGALDHSTSRIARRRFIRSSACTTSFLSSTASRRSTVSFASRSTSTDDRRQFKRTADE